ncbi:MAG: metalloregulator ArsR/SmtB family transcription factor [Rhodospirillales bacterium]|nr:metalloregulator ArsR/SmtB family transcription factor [Rhodospirillales bacterium]
MVEYSLDHVFQALSDPTRRAILDRLAAGEATVGCLAEPLPVSFAAVSKHIGVLERAGWPGDARGARPRTRMPDQPGRAHGSPRLDRFPRTLLIGTSGRA